MKVVVRKTWWMMPLPGFQNPTPYLAPADDKKWYTSELTSCGGA